MGAWTRITLSYKPTADSKPMREEFKIPPAKWPDPEELGQAIMQAEGRPAKPVQKVEVTTAFASSVAEVATHAWKAQTKMTEPETKEAKAEYKNLYRHVEGILEGLKDMGVEIQDHTGTAFNYGLPLKVVTTQPTQGLTKERVIETFKPTIYWHGQIIQMGEVVIATPA
jgi:hypothetical protein